jgi:hypothetical protein
MLQLRNRKSPSDLAPFGIKDIFETLSLKSSTLWSRVGEKIHCVIFQVFSLTHLPQISFSELTWNPLYFCSCVQNTGPVPRHIFIPRIWKHVYSSGLQNFTLCALGRPVLLPKHAVSICTVNIILFTPGRKARPFLSPFSCKTQILNRAKELSHIGQKCANYTQQFLYALK